MRVIFPTDEHRPFQDNQAVELAMKIAGEFDPQLRVAGSDGIDFFTISDFDIDPTRKIFTELQEEINDWKAGQRAWKDATPNAKAVYIPGNHEDRLRRYLWRHPEIAGLDVMQIGSLLGLDKLGIEYDGKDYDFGEIVLYDKLVIRHGRRVRKVSGASVLAELNDDHFQATIAMGHTHRGGWINFATRNGIVSGIECFCLCRLDPQYVARPDWHHGLVLFDVSESHLSVELVPFVTRGNHKVAYWRGKEYAA